MKRKLCSVLLALCMVLTLLPVSAMAEADDSAPAEVPAASNVAKIGDQEYATLADAVEAAESGATITLLNDVALDSTLTLGKNLILDLNGHVISNGNNLGTNYLVKVANGAEVSIIGNKENSSINDTRTNLTGTITAICVLGDLTVDGAELTISRGLNGIAIKVDESGADKLGKLTVKSGKVSSTQAIQNWGITTIDGGTFTGDVGSHAYSSIGGDLTINGGIFNGPVYSAQLKYGGWPTASAKTKIVNGTFNGLVAEYYDDGTNGLQPVERSDKPAGDVNCKVTISGGTFSDLSALGYLADGASVTVKLAADTTKDVTIPAGATVTLDLNGHKLTNVSGHTITNNGKLTVTGSGTVDNVTNAKGALYNCVGATAILNGGTFTRSQEAGTYKPNEGNGNSWYTMQNDGTMTINAGTTVTTRLNDNGKAVGGFSSLIRNGGNAGTAPTLLINGGHFNGGINTVKNDEGGTLTIKGGDFSNTTQYVIMNWNIADIYDGTFEAQSAASAVLFSSSWNGSAGTLNFHGGNVKTTSASQKAIRDYWDKNNKGNVAVSGGIFTVNPTDYVASGAIARKDGDAQYTVVAKSNLTSGVYTSDPSSALAPGYVSYKNSDNSTYTVYYPVPVTPGNNNNSSSTTTKNPDGSTTTTTTDKTTGTVTETTKNPDGSTTTVETKKDGSVTETNKTAGGSVGTVKSDANGNSEISANISAADVNAAAKKNEPVAAPVSVAPAASPAAAPVIKLSVPASAGEVSVVIPVTNAQQGTVAIKVNPDGTEEIIKTSVVTKDGVVLGVKGSAQIKIVNNDKDFSDTVGHWAESDVDFVSARELFTGTAPQTFSPEAATTRGMVVTVLARLAGESTDGGANWYDKGCAWAVTNGVSDGTDPNGTVTREQLAAMLYRYFGSPAVSGSLSFADASSVSEYAHDAMQWCVNNGIINGMDGLLNPQGQATRAQVSAMFARYIRLMSTK